MRNKELVVKKMETAEGAITAIEILMTRPNTAEDIIARIGLLKQTISEIKSMIEREPHEFN